MIKNTQNYFLVIFGYKKKLQYCDDNLYKEIQFVQQKKIQEIDIIFFRNYFCT